MFAFLIAFLVCMSFKVNALLISSTRFTFLPMIFITIVPAFLRSSLSLLMSVSLVMLVSMPYNKINSL